MEALFLTVLELSLRGSLLILAILPIRALLKSAPRWSICLLWVLAAIALVCPVRFESTASVVPESGIITEIIATPVPTMPLVQSEPIMIPDIIENGTPVPAPAPTQPDYAFIATLLWLVGMAVMLSVAAVSYVRLKKQVAASLPVKDKVYLCDDIDTPFILGIVRPRIYLPSALDTTLYHSVLLHEYAHLKRRDHWWKPLGYLLLTVHWFNPLVWLGYGLLCRDIELACDEKVIRDMDGQHKKDYSEALLQCSMPRHLITACPLAFGEVGAKQRIKAVLSYKKPAFWVIVIVLLLCAALALGFLTDPKVTTLGELSGFTAEMRFIYAYDGTYVDEDSIRSAIDTDHVREELAQVEIRRRLIAPSGSHDDWHTITLYLAEKDAYYRLVISPDFTALRYLYIEETDRGQTTQKSPYYEVSDPTELRTVFRSGALFKTGGVALGELSDMTSADIGSMAIYSEPSSGRSVANIAAACEQLGKLDLLYAGTCKLHADENKGRIELRGHDTEVIGTLYFPSTYSTLWIADASGETATQYQVLNPDVLNSLIHSEVFYRQSGISSVDPAVQMEVTFSPTELETAVMEYLDNKNKNIANLSLIGNVFSDRNAYYAVVSMDYTARDGSVIAENNLYLAQIRYVEATPAPYFLVEGLAGGEWGMSAGYYPNVADFGDRTVLWTTRSDTHLKVFDGGVGYDGTVPNEFHTYRITCESGNVYDWTVKNSTGVYLLPAGETPIRVAPLYDNGSEVSAFAFGEDYLQPVEVRTISEQSGWNLFMEMDASTGQVLELHGLPTVAESFQGHEALYAALRSNSELIVGDKKTLVLLGQQSYGDYEYAVISYDDHEAVLVEYTLAGGTVTLLNYAVGHTPDTTGMRTGYRMNESNMEGGILYWSVYAPRYKVTPNGKDVDESLETVTPDFSGFRFTMRDLKTYDFPADDSFFLCEFTGVIPPSLVTPMENGKLLAALGSEFSGGLTGTISLQG